MNLTPEQEAVAHTALAGVTKVVAYAGTGKTTALVALSQRQPQRRRGLYVAFTKSAELDASQRFPRGVKCKTINALAFATTGRLYAHKLGEVRAITVIKLMGLSWDWGFAKLVVDTLAAWCASDMETFPTHAIAIGHQPAGQEHLLNYAAVVAAKLWQRMCDPKDEAPMPHEGYLKLFQLQHPVLPYDYLMLDEAQDTNPATWDIVQRQTCPVVLVGDAYQSIFEFRGAINAMDRAQSDRCLTLTQSFRFGPRVARIANALLWGFFDEMLPVQGSGFDTVVRRLPPEASRHAVVARTNAQIFSEAVQGLMQRKTLGFAGGINSYGFEKIIDTWHLADGQPGLVRDSFLRTFSTYDALADYAEHSNDLEVRRLIKMVETYGAEVITLVQAIRAACHPSLDAADLVLSTAHRCKGLTLPVVRLAEDFPGLIDDNGRLLGPDKLDRQEVNLLYVAITRAQRHLMLNGTTLDFMRAMGLVDLVDEHAGGAVLGTVAPVVSGEGAPDRTTHEPARPSSPSPAAARQPRPSLTQGDLFAI